MTRRASFDRPYSRFVHDYKPLIEEAKPDFEFHFLHDPVIIDDVFDSS